jgi:hypothetical protein
MCLSLGPILDTLGTYFPCLWKRSDVEDSEMRDTVRPHASRAVFTRSRRQASHASDCEWVHGALHAFASSLPVSCHRIPRSECCGSIQDDLAAFAESSGL